MTSLTLRLDSSLPFLTTLIEYGRNYYDEDDLGSDEDDLGSDEDEEAEVSEDEDEDADCECPYVFDDEDDTTKELSIDRIFAEDGELSHQTR